MNLAKLHMLLDQGLTVQINLTKLNDCDMIAAVNIIKTKEDAGKSISTRPFIMKGSPKEIEENLVPQLMLKESAILRTFKILDEDFDKSLKQIEKDGTAPADGGHPAPLPRPHQADCHFLLSRKKVSG